MAFPTLRLKNQYGEQSSSYVLGGTAGINLSFVVDSANVNGLGIKNLSGDTSAKVYMHTSQTPATGNPNPVVGLILIQLGAAHAAFLNSYYMVESPNSGSSINVTSGLTNHQAYIITAVGTTTTLQWQTLGFPVGQTPAVGASFVAITASAGSGTGTVALANAIGAGITLIDVVGDPNLTANSTDGSGAWIIFRCLAATASGTTTLVATAPVDGTMINLVLDYSGTVKES